MYNAPNVPSQAAIRCLTGERRAPRSIPFNRFSWVVFDFNKPCSVQAGEAPSASESHVQGNSRNANAVEQREQRQVPTWGALALRWSGTRPRIRQRWRNLAGP
eukprot:11113437-Alexandrium_andersonii.AAC.1